MLVKFNDQNGFKIKNYEKFVQLPYLHKIFITADPELNGKNDVIFINNADKDGSIADDTKQLRKCNIKGLLNSL